MNDISHIADDVVPIIASIQNAALVSRPGEQTGTIEAGKLADILVVSENPLENLQNLRSIRLVIHAGKIIRDESQKT